MKKIIRADIYRTVRGKALYITLAVLIAIILLQIGVSAAMNAAINNSAAEINFENFEGMEIADIFQEYTGRDAPNLAMKESGNIVYFILPLIIVIATSDFSCGAAKNTLAGGVSRKKYYCSKLFLTCVTSALLFLAYILLSMLFAIVFYGFQGAFDGEFLWNVFKVFLPQLLFCIAAACVGNFFVFLLRRRGAFIGIYLAFFLVPPILIGMLTVIDEWFSNLMDYVISFNFLYIAQIDTLGTNEIIRALAVGAGYIVLSVFGGYFVFKKGEIR